MEKSTTNRILKALRERGAWVVKVHGGGMQAAGLPDLIGVWQGVAFGIEVKDANAPAPTTPLQMATLKAIRAAGGRAGVARSVRDAIEIIGITDSACGD